MALIFHLFPAIENARNTVPPEVYDGTGECGCSCISNSRPWYSVFNYWFWLWVIFPLRVIIYIKPREHILKKTLITLTTIGICYGLMNLALHLSWDIRNDIFYGLDASLTNDKICANIADGGSIVFYLVLGWIPASMYIAFCFLLRSIFTKDKMKKNDKVAINPKTIKLSYTSIIIRVLIIALFIMLCWFTLLYYFPTYLDDLWVSLTEVTDAIVFVTTLLIFVLPFIYVPYALFAGATISLLIFASIKLYRKIKK